jgi:subtilisin family serine protease
VSNRADVIALPFGTHRGAAPIAQAIRRSVDSGCTVLAAAGNHGPEELCFPAWLPEVTAVSALGANGEVHLHCCAREEVDIFAPGEDVPAVRPDGRARLCGSSPATVLTAGIVALRRAQLLRRINRGRETPETEFSK